MRSLTVLGCGDAFSSGGRFNTSFIVQDLESAFLIDCGATTLLSMKKLNVPLEKVNQIFITHFHGDHYGGLPFLIISYAFQIKDPNPITIFGPKGIKSMVRNLQDAMYPGTSNLLDELPLSFIEYNLEWQIAKGMEVRAFEVKHAPPSLPHGLKFKWNEKSMAFSGDTEWIDSLVDLSDDTEIFILECNNHLDETPGHLCYRTIQSKIDSFNTQKLFLTHMGDAVLDSFDIDFEKLQDGQEIQLW